MYTTKKAIKKYKRNQILGVILLVSGILSFILSFDQNQGIFQGLGSVLHSIVMVGSGIMILVVFRKKTNEHCNQNFSFNKSGIKINNGSKLIEINISELASIEKNLEELHFKKKSGEETNIKLGRYLLSFEESKALNIEISELKKKFS